MGSVFSGFILLLLLNISQAHNLIEDVCSKSENPPLCNRILSSDPQCSEVRIPKLCEIIVKKAIFSTQIALQITKSLSIGVNKQKCDVCGKSYSNAINNLNDCQRLLNTNDRGSISTLRSRLSTVKTDVTTCDNQFGGSQPPMLKAANHRCQVVASVLCVIANRM
ncbi:pectinesterase inhibitor-like [Sesamum indicum]|uniref:Pectinesterase inhibitor-like n=1 Tax=Sesamum indicum TaxID=4182 RepID=A0A6I9UBP4_SESIN|nr:pectinesterase inhibitor-like [Sesamum indicum]